MDASIRCFIITLCWSLVVAAKSSTEPSGVSNASSTSRPSDDVMLKSKSLQFTSQIFHEYGTDSMLSLEGFEHLLHRLGLGDIHIDDHDVHDHFAQDGTFVDHLHVNHEHIELTNRSADDVSIDQLWLSHLEDDMRKQEASHKPHRHRRSGSDGDGGEGTPEHSTSEHQVWSLIKMRLCQLYLHGKKTSTSVLPCLSLNWINPQRNRTYPIYMHMVHVTVIIRASPTRQQASLTQSLDNKS